MYVREVMISSIPTVGADASLREAAEILAELRGGAVLVVTRAGKIVGIVTEAVLAGALDRIVETGEAARGSGSPPWVRSTRPRRSRMSTVPWPDGSHARRRHRAPGEVMPRRRGRARLPGEIGRLTATA